MFFTLSSETPEEVGMVLYWPYPSDRLFLNSFCFGYRLSNEIVTAGFLALLLRSEDYRRRISILVQGSTRFNISRKEIMKLQVKIPVAKEQDKIVKLMNNLQNLIDDNKKRETNLKVLKKRILTENVHLTLCSKLDYIK